MKTVLICHADDNFSKDSFARWLSSFSELVGIVQIQEDGSRAKQRIKAEIKRSGLLRFIFDVVPYRIFSRVIHSRKDQLWVDNKIKKIAATYKELPASVEILTTNSPNSSETSEFISRLAPDMALARCKTLIRKEIYSIPVDGTYILHPGICPEYRNAHGCFWALANNEPEKVGATLLKIDDGVDTGPIYGYYSYPFDPKNETPAVIHYRVVYDNLDQIKNELLDIHDGTAKAIDISGRRSGVWGQPWLSKYVQYRFKDNKGC